MEYVDGQTLRDVVHKYRHGSPPMEAARIAAEIADALDVRAPQRRRAPRREAGQRAHHAARAR